jgi:phosphoesterase RecJ-like protein
VPWRAGKQFNFQSFIAATIVFKVSNSSLYKEADNLISQAQKILVLQADNPDTDSLASALALEHILSDLGKDVRLYCGVDLPSYLKYLPGSDRVSKELPSTFDLSIIVDTSSLNLLEQIDKNGKRGWLASRPLIIFDHHKTPSTIDFANLEINEQAVAAGEVIYRVAKGLNWPINQEAKKLIAISILSDSLGLTSEATTAGSIYVIAELVDSGVNLAEIENARRETMRRDKELIYYKGQLLQRIEFYDNDQIALLLIPWQEIEKYSPLYNPSMLVIDDMRLAKNTAVAICFKVYKDGRITAKIRTNFGYGIAGKLAEHFDGGGHTYASGFKITDGRSYEDIKQEALSKAAELLQENSA